ncbi:hypothetical protein PVK06_040109 [Gossypium arboreum]|uniref:Uncharacterized protein n=1 Tax=Gossypium arboreum TaxID=29729 RepID=A0ABR0N6S2_GOSAR|nr:hypothetical protein PVK06_040109 [Gossypium arboreum]
MTVVPTGSGHIASSPNFKRHRVSAVWDFPPGCGRVTAPNFRLSRQIIVDRSSQGSNPREFLVLYVIRCVSVLYRQNAEKSKIWCMMPHERAIARVVNRAYEYGR